MENPEVHPAHARHGGLPRWLELLIAVHHGRIMERLVQANRGVGPAHEQSLQVRVDGRYVKSTSELIRASLGPELAAEAERALAPMKNGLKTRFMPGGQEQLVFRMFRTAENGRFWDSLEQAQGRWDVEYCYCSVFDDCWEVLGKWEEPKPVEACVRDETREFMP